MLHCSKCNRILMNVTEDGGYKVRSRMILFKDGEATAICPQCKKRNYVPIQLGSVDGLFSTPDKFVLKK